MTERRLKNIVQRMLNGEDFYTNFSPRISNAEIKEVETRLDTRLQRDHTEGANPGPIAIFPLHDDEFAKKARKFLKEAPEK